MVPLQLRLAETMAAVDFFETQFRADLAEMVAQTAAGTGSPRADKLRWKRNLAYGVRLAKQAMDNIMSMSGAGGLLVTGPLQRHFRDLSASAAHIALTWDVQAPMYGQDVLGLPASPGFLV